MIMDELIATNDRLTSELAVKTAECERLREALEAGDARQAEETRAMKASAQWPQCSCVEIQAADVSRHFRECLRRAVYPEPSAPKPQPVESQGPDRCRKGTPECTVDHTGMLGGYSECVAPKPQPVEQTKVVSVISLSDRPQPEPAKVEPAVCNAAYSGSTCAYEYDHPGDHLFSIMKAEPAKVEEREDGRKCFHPPGCTFCGWCGFGLENALAVDREREAEPAKVACTDCGGDGWDMGREGPYVCAPCRGRGKVEPVKVEAPERVTLVKTVDRGWMVRLETGPGTVDYVRLDIHDATQAALYSANELLDDSFMHDKSWKERTADLHAALAQAEAERDRAIGLLYALNECRHAPAIQGLETFLTELDATKPQPVEPAKVVSVISLSDRPQSAEPAKVEAPNPDGICQQCGEFMGTDDGLDPTAICHACAHQLLEETQVALAAANAADEVHRKGCDIAMAALVQAEAENRCDVCAGEPLASGMTCMCGGTGKMSEAVSVVRKAWADALVERDVVLNLLIEYGGDRIDVWQQERRRLLAEYDAKKGGPK